jgi:hypothetical protein
MTEHGTRVIKEFIAENPDEVIKLLAEAAFNNGGNLLLACHRLFPIPGELPEPSRTLLVYASMMTDWKSVAAELAPQVIARIAKSVQYDQDCLERLRKDWE